MLQRLLPTGAMTPNKTPAVHVRFAITFAGQSDEIVFVMGSIPQLGDWESSRAIPLHKTASQQWFTEVMIPAGTSFNYRYFVQNNRTKDICHETEIQRNLSLTSKSLSAMMSHVHVSDVWQYPAAGESVIGKEDLHRTVMAEPTMVSAHPWQDECLQLREHVATLVKTRDEMVQSRVAEETRALREQRATLDQCLRTLSDQNTICETQLKEAVARNAELTAQLALLQTTSSEHAELTITVQKSAEEVSQLRQQVAALQTALAQVTAQATAASDHSASLQASLSEAIAAKADLTMQLVNVTQELTSSRTTADDQKQELVLLNQLLHASRTQSDGLSHQVQALQAQLACTEEEASRNAAQFASDKQQADTIIAGLRSTQASMARLHSAMEQQVLELTDQLAQLRKDSEYAAAAAMSALQEAMQTLVPKVASLQSSNASLQSQVASLMTDLRHLFNENLNLKGNIRVFCRVRPQSRDETSAGDNVAVVTEGNRLMMTAADRSSGKSFAFDRVFGPESSQEQVFTEVEPLVRSALDGYSVCVFAYGQTGAGKTFTMMGCPAAPGLIPRSMDALFGHAAARRPLWQFEFKVSVFEIYNEALRDLLNPANEAMDIKSTAEGTRVVGLHETAVSCTADVMTTMAQAAAARSVATTNMNADSSRSHMILSMAVKGTDTVNGDVLQSVVYMIDLGAEGQALKEAQHINKSLSALGDVMAALQTKAKHIPFRNSRLTHLLSSVLGGQARVLMVSNISPVTSSTGETVCTLQFAKRAASVHLGETKAAVDTGAVAKQSLSETQDKLDKAYATINSMNEQHQAELELARTRAAELEAALRTSQAELAAARALAASASMNVVAAAAPAPAVADLNASYASIGCDDLDMSVGNISAILSPDKLDAPIASSKPASRIARPAAASSILGIAKARSNLTTAASSAGGVKPAVASSKISAATERRRSLRGLAPRPTENAAPGSPASVASARVAGTTTQAMTRPATASGAAGAAVTKVPAKGCAIATANGSPTKKRRSFGGAVATAQAPLVESSGKQAWQ